MQAEHYVEKFGGVIRTDPKVINENTSNFGPILKFSL